MPLTLEFIGAQPDDDEIAALQAALQRLFLAQRNGGARMSPWRLATRYTDATLEDLRRHAVARWDVF